MYQSFKGSNTILQMLEFSILSYTEYCKIDYITFHEKLLPQNKSVLLSSYSQSFCLTCTFSQFLKCGMMIEWYILWYFRLAYCFLESNRVLDSRISEYNSLGIITTLAYVQHFIAQFIELCNLFVVDTFSLAVFPLDQKDQADLCKPGAKHFIIINLVVLETKFDNFYSAHDNISYRSA